MSLRLASVALLAALAVLPGAARADGLKRFHQTGEWTSYAGLSDRGNPMCMTMTDASVGDATGSIMVKFSANNPGIVLVHLSKTSWKIPEGASLRIELQVDNAPGRTYEAKAVGDHMVGFVVNREDTDSVTGEPTITLLFNLLKSGQTLNANFPDGSEHQWQASLNGSSAELDQFVTCIHTVKMATNTTQPVGHSITTQPFRETSKEPDIPQENNEAIRKVILPYLNMPR